jgi:Pyruvate/2-oxoacid:ferredoxin oxidoreductase gamma subunit
VIVGFTGTRKGMTDEQKAAVANLLSLLHPTEVHHGDCKGADADFNNLVRKKWLSGQFLARIVAHPGMNSKGLSPSRAYCDVDVECMTFPYLSRDMDIVLVCDELIATPAEFKEQRRGGTWATIRMARRSGKPIRIVYPDGNVKRENQP